MGNETFYRGYQNTKEKKKDCVMLKNKNTEKD